MDAATVPPPVTPSHIQKAMGYTLPEVLTNMIVEIGDVTHPVWPHWLVERVNHAQLTSSADRMIDLSRVPLIDEDLVLNDIRTGRTTAAGVRTRLAVSFEIHTSERVVWVSPYQEKAIYEDLISVLKETHPGLVDKLNLRLARHATAALRDGHPVSGRSDADDSSWKVMRPILVVLQPHTCPLHRADPRIESLVLDIPVVVGDTRSTEAPPSQSSVAPVIDTDCVVLGMFSKESVDAVSHWKLNRELQLQYMAESAAVSSSDDATGNAWESLRSRCLREIRDGAGAWDSVVQELVDGWDLWVRDPVMQAATAHPITYMHIRRTSERETGERSAAIRIMSFLSNAAEPSIISGVGMATGIHLRRVTRRLLARVTGSKVYKLLPRSNDIFEMAAALRAVGVAQPLSMPAPHISVDGEKAAIKLFGFLHEHQGWHDCADVSVCRLALLMAHNNTLCQLPTELDETTQHVTPQYPMSSADQAVVDEALDSLIASKSVEVVEVSDETDPTVVACVMPVSVAHKFKYPAPKWTGPGLRDAGWLQGEANHVANSIWEEFGVNLSRGDTPVVAFQNASASFEKKAKPRMVFDARSLSAMCPKMKFSMPTIDEVLLHIPKESYTVCVDICAGFHHLCLGDSMRNKLCFKWKGRVWRWTRLCLGLGLSPLAFCAFSSELQQMLLSRGIRCEITFVDDLCVSARSAAEAWAALAILREIFANMGIELSEEKTKPPSQVQEVLGIVLDTGKLELRVPDDKAFNSFVRLAILDRAFHSTMKGADHMPVSFIQKTVGKLSWQASLTPGAQAMMAPLYLLARRAEESTAASVSVRQVYGLPATLEWWQGERGAVPARGLRATLHATSMVTTILPTMQSDAAIEKGYGVVCGAHAIWGSFSERYRRSGASSTSAELYASLAGVIHFPPQAGSSLVIIQTDSVANAGAVNKGSSDSESCRGLIKALYNYCATLEQHVVATFLPRQANLLADALTHAHDIAEAQDMMDAACRACRVDKIRVWHAPHFTIGDGGRVQVHHVCRDACTACCIYVGKPTAKGDGYRAAIGSIYQNKVLAHKAT